MSQKTDLIAQPYIDQGGEVERVSDAVERTKIAKLAASSRRAAQAERERILAEEWEESETIRDRLRELDLPEEYDELASQSDATERRATSSEWESALDPGSDEDDGRIKLLAPKKRRKRKKFGQRERQEGHVLKRQGRDDLDILLSILHLGLITLRIPVAWADLCK